MIFLYDGTFEGFLSAVFDAFLVKEEVVIGKKNGFQPQFFTEMQEVETSQEKAGRVASKLLEVCGNRGFTAIVYIFLSEEEHCETYDLYLTDLQVFFRCCPFEHSGTEPVLRVPSCRSLRCNREQSPSVHIS